MQYKRGVYLLALASLTLLVSLASRVHFTMSGSHGPAVSIADGGEPPPPPLPWPPSPGVMAV